MAGPDLSQYSDEELRKLAGLGPLKIPERTPPPPVEAPPPETPDLMTLLGQRPNIGLRTDAINPIDKFPETDTELALSALGALGAVGGEFMGRAPTAVAANVGRRLGWIDRPFAKGAASNADELLRAAGNMPGRITPEPIQGVAEQITSKITPGAPVPLSVLGDARNTLQYTKNYGKGGGQDLYKSIYEALRREAAAGNEEAAQTLRSMAQERAGHDLFSRPSLRSGLVGAAPATGAGFGVGVPQLGAGVALAELLRRLGVATAHAPRTPGMTLGGWLGGQATGGLGRALSEEP